uniref:ABC transporter permease n=1 Tax=Nocardiopsis ganjiahuensis TaxID=239984 RepID=UPI000381622A
MVDTLPTRHTGPASNARRSVPDVPGTAPAAARRSRRHGALPPLVSVLLALTAWYAVSYLVLSEDRRFLLPPPHRVLTHSLLDPLTLGTMLRALAVTAQVALLGLFLAAVLGVAAAVLMSQSRAIERVVYPYAVVLQVVPVLAIVPLIGLWFGYGLPARTIVCVLIAFFPVVSMTLFGLQSVDRDLHDLFTLGRAGRWRRLLSLQLPAALPSVITSLRTAAGLSVTGAVIGDMFFAQGQAGIGTLLDTYRARLQSEDLIAAILLAALLGVAVFSVFTVVQRL